MAIVKKNRGKLFGEWESISVDVGHVEDKPTFVVLKLDGSSDREILFTEAEAKDLVNLVTAALKEF